MSQAATAESGAVRFDAATRVHPVGGGRYHAHAEGVWGMAGNCNGAYLLATITRAAMAATGACFPHAVSASYLSAVREGQVEVRVEILRTGRTVTQVRCSLAQAGTVAVDATLALGAAPRGRRDPDFRIALPPPEAECQPAAARPEPGFDRRVAVSYAPGEGPRDSIAADASPPRARLRGWVRLRSGEQPDPLVALLAADALAPSVNRLGYRGWSPTVQLTAHAMGMPAPGPLAVQTEAGEIRDGWFSEQATVADATGTVVLRSYQLARVSRRRVTP